MQHLMMLSNLFENIRLNVFKNILFMASFFLNRLLMGHVWDFPTGSATPQSNVTFRLPDLLMFYAACIKGYIC